MNATPQAIPTNRTRDTLSSVMPRLKGLTIIMTRHDAGIKAKVENFARNAKLIATPRRMLRRVVGLSTQCKNARHAAPQSDAAATSVVINPECPRMAGMVE